MIINQKISNTLYGYNSKNKQSFKKQIIGGIISFAMVMYLVVNYINVNSQRILLGDGTLLNEHTMKFVSITGEEICAPHEFWDNAKVSDLIDYVNGDTAFVGGCLQNVISDKVAVVQVLYQDHVIYPRPNTSPFPDEALIEFNHPGVILLVQPTIHVTKIQSYFDGIKLQITPIQTPGLTKLTMEDNSFKDMKNAERGSIPIFILEFEIDKLNDKNVKIIIPDEIVKMIQTFFEVEFGQSDSLIGRRTSLKSSIVISGEKKYYFMFIAKSVADPDELAGIIVNFIENLEFRISN